MTIDIIIPNYNGANLISKNLPYVLKALEKHKGKVIIVDDASTQEEKVKLKNEIEKFGKEMNEIILLENEKNLGFAATVNIGVNKSTADYIVLLNSDVRPYENFLDNPLRSLNSDKNIFAVGCLDESIENDKKALRGRGIGYWQNGLLNHKRGEVDKNDTFWVSGGSGIFNRAIWEKLGGMDTIYAPFYWEDIDLSYRAQKAGYEILFDRNSKVIHEHEKGAIKSNYNSQKIKTIAYKNQFIFIWKNITDDYFLFNHLISLPILFLGALKRHDKSFFMGFWYAFIKLPAIIQKRKNQKKYYKFSDLEIISKIK